MSLNLFGYIKTLFVIREEFLLSVGSTVLISLQFSICSKFQLSSTNSYHIQSINNTILNLCPLKSLFASLYFCPTLKPKPLSLNPDIQLSSTNLHHIRWRNIMSLNLLWYNKTLLVIRDEFLHSKAIFWPLSPLFLLYLFRYNSPFVVSFS